MKIVAFELEDWEREAFESLQEQHDVVFAHERLTADNVDQYSDAEIVSPFIYSDLSAEILERFDKLQLIATRSTGFDHIDTDYCRKHDINVSNVPVYGDNTVAEHVFALLLAISHRMIESVNRTRRGDFSQEGLQGFDLQGKTLGVIGTGSIGRCVIEIARGFGMRVLACDIAEDEELAIRLGFQYVELDDLLGQSDVVTLHVPANEKTRQMISEREFGIMKEGVVLINTARGEIVDIRALIGALSTGKVSAAGLDVLPDEPTIREEAELLRSVFREEHDLETLLAGHILLRLRNVIITPHNAFNTREAIERILETTVQNIQAFLQGAPQNVIVGAIARR